MIGKLEADLETMAQRVVDATFPKEFHIRKLRGSLEIAEKLIENLRTNNLLDIREVKRVCNAEMTKAVKQAVKVLKIEQSEKDTNYGKKILKLQSELQELRQPKSPADERAMQAELKMVRLEAKLKKQSEQTEKYRLMAESVREELDGESIEELKERLKSAELDWDFAQDRCNILQTNMDDARKRLTEAEDGVRTRTHELENMSCKLYMANALANTLRQERKRDGKGDIFVEDGRVLFRCEMCLEVYIFQLSLNSIQLIPTFPQLNEDPILHGKVKHAHKDPLRRFEPCPMGCGMLLRPKPYQSCVPQSDFDYHVSEEVCKNRLELVCKLKSECYAAMG